MKNKEGVKIRERKRTTEDAVGGFGGLGVQDGYEYKIG